MAGIELRDGWYWPEKDKGCWEWTLREHDLPQKIMAHVKNFDICIHAGANAGFYAKQYSKRFRIVVALEPHPLNFQCLSLNCPEDNIIKVNAAFGESHGWGSLVGDITGEENAGGWMLRPGKDFPVLTIDDFIGSVGLIHLDVEGHEHSALLGATQVLTHSPVVCLETIMKGDDNLAQNLLLCRGYKVLETLWHDTIYGM